MIRRSLASRIARQIDVGAVMHARTAARDNNDAAALIAALAATGQIEVAGGREQRQQRHGQKVVRRRVDAEAGFPVAVVR